MQAAVSASRTKKSTFLSEKYRRLVNRCGPKRALVAVAHKIAIAVYHILRDGTVFKDRDPPSIDPRTKKRTINRLVQRLQELGFDPATLKTPDPNTLPQGSFS